MIKVMVRIVAITMLLGSLFIWFGFFNVSAKDKHWDITTVLLSVIKDRSVDIRSSNIDVPAVVDQEMISRGAKNYDAMCAQCHLAPGLEPTELQRGLYPKPPIFHKFARSDEDLAATFWVIKNGLKMTGMPAWGDMHTEQQIWELVAFLNKAKGLSLQQYKEWVGEGGHTHAGDGHDSGHLDGPAMTAKPSPDIQNAVAKDRTEQHDDGHSHEH